MNRGKENNHSMDMQRHRVKHQLAAVVARNQALQEEDEMLAERLRAVQNTLWTLENKENTLRSLKTNLSTRCATMDQMFQKTLESHSKSKQAEIAILQRKGAELEARLKKVGDADQGAEKERGELLAKISEVLDSHRNAESEDPARGRPLPTASGSLSHGGLPSTRASGPDRPGRATVVGPLGCLRFGTAGLRCLS
jgi:peptidoglycan hydrolase CwlO-like protein